MADQKSEVVEKKKDKTKWWHYPLWIIGGLIAYFVMATAIVGSMSLLLPGLFLDDIEERAFLDAEKVVADLELITSESDSARFESELDSIETNCARGYVEWQECMAAYRELNRLVHDYYGQHSDELDAFDPYLKDDIADFDQSISDLEAEYARFRESR